jgi:hypothetical protein
MVAGVGDGDGESEHYWAAVSVLRWYLGEAPLRFLDVEYPAGSADAETLRALYVQAKDVRERLVRVPPLQFRWYEVAGQTIAWLRSRGAPPVDDQTWRLYLELGQRAAS